VHSTDAVSHQRFGLPLWRALRRAFDAGAPHQVESGIRRAEEEIAAREGVEIAIGDVRVSCEGVSERMRESAASRVAEMLADPVMQRTLEGFTVVVIPHGERRDKDVVADYVGVEPTNVLVLPEERLASREEAETVRQLTRSLVSFVTAFRPWPRLRMPGFGAKLVVTPHRG
jgi:hypothetical protein